MLLLSNGAAALGSRIGVEDSSRCSEITAAVTDLVRGTKLRAAEWSSQFAPDSGLLAIPCRPWQFESAQCLQASTVQVVASGSKSSQPTRRETLAAVKSVAGTLDSIPPSSAPLSSSSLCRQASKVRAVCVNAPVRICGGDQR